MAVTLADEIRVERSPLRKAVLQNLRMSSPIAELATIRNINDLHTVDIRWRTLPSVGFRGLNEGYTESTGTTDTVPVDLKFLGGDFDVDLALRSNDSAVVDMMALQQQMKMKALAYALNDYFINGDPATDQKQFPGLKALIAQLEARQTISGGTNGLDVSPTNGTDANRQKWLDLLDQAIWECHEHRADAIIMNQEAYLQLRSALRRLQLLDVTRDQYERTIESYRGARLVDIGFKSDDSTNIIPNNETQGTNTKTTSIYVVRFGDPYVSLVQKGGIQVRAIGELESKPVFRTRVEWYVAVGLIHKASAVRLKGIQVVD
jgi:hypothetical protein